MSHHRMRQSLVAIGTVTLAAAPLHAHTQADMNQDACAQIKKPIRR